MGPVKTSLSLFLSALALFLLTGCGVNKEQHAESPEHYDFLTPKKYIMPDALLEISGIAILPHNNDSVLAIADEMGTLYALCLGNKKTRKLKFGKRGDYEDVAIYKNNAIVLRSDGTLFEFPLSTKKVKDSTTKIADHVLPKGEYEGLYVSETGLLYVLCKQAGLKKEAEKEIKGYVFEAHDTAWTLKDSFVIASHAIPKKHFEPSALAQHALTHDWYILSSVHKKLLVTDSLWNVKQVISLNPKLFHQPEGIAFDHHHNLFVSNEGDEILNGNILRFEYIK